MLSGSWDETARGWDLETAECKWVLSGHEVRRLMPILLLYTRYKLLLLLLLLLLPL